MDFAADRATRVLDWNREDIDWQGRGCGRGLRGVAFDGETVYVAASDELLAFTPDFRPLGSWRNRNLRLCQEICRHERMLFLASAGFDCVLGFHLDAKSFSFGLQVTAHGDGFSCRTFDPEFEGPPPSESLRLNNVHCEAGGMHISGLRTGGILLYNGRELRRWVRLPAGVHNARPFRGGVLFNDTESDAVRFESPGGGRAFRVPRYPVDGPSRADAADERVARQGFARGLCVVDDDHFAAGSSPATVTLHDLRADGRSRTATLSRDVHNAVHGLAVWPFSRVAAGAPAP